MESLVAESTTVMRVPVAQVLPHPANPRRDLGDLDDLTTSIGEQGILQPPTVLPAARVAAAWSSHQATIEASGADWVLLMGHRRRAAAEAVGLTEITVVVRDDAVADDAAAQLDAMTAENTARSALTPMEEARAFAAARDAGRSQAKIAAAAGRAQSHVSKRLSLLGLPEPVITEIEAGGLEVTVALQLTKHSADVAIRTVELMREHAGTWRGGALRALEDADEEIRLRNATRKSQKRIAAEGLDLVDPAKEWGHDAWNRRLSDETAIETAKADGTLAAGISQYDGKVEYYTTVEKAPSRWAAESARRESDAKARKAAAASRDQINTVLVGKAPELPEATCAAMVDTVIASASSDAARLASRWLANAGVEVDITNWGGRRRTLVTQPWPIRRRIAHALGVGEREARLRGAHGPWDTFDAAWMRELIAAGHTPSEWETTQLDAATDHAATDTDADVDESAS